MSGLTLTAADLARIEADMTAIRGEWSHSVAFRRVVDGVETTLAAQPVRVAAEGGPSVRQGQAADETRTGIVLIGSRTLDVRRNDRFNVDGRLYRVTGVHPDNRAFTQARAELVQ